MVSANLIKTGFVGVIHLWVNDRWGRINLSKLTPLALQGQGVKPSSKLTAPPWYTTRSLPLQFTQPQNRPIPHTHTHNCLYGGFPMNHLIQRFNIVVSAPKPNPINKRKSCFYHSNANIFRHVLTASKYSCFLCYYGYQWSKTGF